MKHYIFYQLNLQQMDSLPSSISIHQKALESTDQKMSGNDSVLAGE